MSASPQVIAGRVVDEAGSSVAMASVYVLEAPVALPDIAQLTGPDGGFRLSAPVPGTYRIGVRHDRYAPAEASARVDAGRAETAVEIVLRPG